MTAVNPNNWPISRRPPGRPKAFTLTEVLIALGILAVGLTMAAALFPAGIKENQRSTNDVIGSMICRNGMDSVRAAFDTADMDNLLSNDPFSITPDSRVQPIALSAAESCYPTPTTLMPPSGPDTPEWKHVSSSPDIYLPQSLMGMSVFVRRRGAVGVNDYDLTIVAYKRLDASDLVVPAGVSASVANDPLDDTQSVLTGVNNFDGDSNLLKYLRPGGIVITSPASMNQPVEFAKIVAIDSSDNDPANWRFYAKPRLAYPGGGADLWTIVQTRVWRSSDPYNPKYWALEELSPAIFAMTTRTALVSQ